MFEFGRIGLWRSNDSLCETPPRQCASENSPKSSQVLVSRIWGSGPGSGTGVADDQVWLGELSLKAISQSFLEYLESYIVLGKLEVLELYSALPSLRLSLKNMGGQGQVWGWVWYGALKRLDERVCEGDESLEVVKVCRELEEVWVCVDPRAVGQVGTRDDIVTKIMFTMIQLPSLRLRTDICGGWLCGVREGRTGCMTRGGRLG
ncbi:hypothetical protein D9758_014064 [Tetrapyrgos nigripes]|uniref:Uncharacterized protein n=1 Tax=Tetrapyrgos nigripes TaxID=182062 RepID=A0A8H5FLX0_9AGAR|nr:hypothetical protein D9758_014064 [Tetrapyrgos nigripes]